MCAVPRFGRGVRISALSLVGLCLPCTPALAIAGQHTTLASFQANTRANSILEPFNGPNSPNIPSIVFSGTGFSATVDVDNPIFGLFRDPSGIGSASPNEGTQFTFTGRPVSAFGGTFLITDVIGVSVGGTMSFVTDTGESFSVPIPVAGTFFGFTTTRPFTVVTFNAPQTGAAFEAIDNAYVGIAANAPELSDQCADAETVNPITAVQYPFTTVGTGAAATTISGSCSVIDTGADVWIRLVSPVYGDVTINTCGATFDTILRVFANCGPAGNGVGAMQIACNDDFCTGGGFNLGSQVQFRAEAGEDYLVRVSGYNGATGSGNLSFSVVPDCAADVNHSGGTPTVQDIFDFLAAYFAGC